MGDKVTLTLAEVDILAQRAARRMDVLISGRRPRVYAIPRGGVPAALAMRAHREFDMVDDPRQADYIVDDLVDTGGTMARVCEPLFDVEQQVKPIVLIDKLDPGCEPELRDAWIVFPWEGDAVGSVEDNIVRLLQFIGEDPTRGGLLETPARATKAWQEWTSGYTLDPKDVLKVFEDGAEGCDEMVVVKDIPFYSKCEHHLADIFGTATIAYVPNGKIVGLSKLNRVLEVYARRLQVQERLTAQVADALMEHLDPKGAGVVIKARHMCMESRGVRQQGHHTVTSALRGVFKSEPSTRAEFLALAR